jgi:lipopolysaccharide export system protein LptA
MARALAVSSALLLFPSGILLARPGEKAPELSPPEEAVWTLEAASQEQIGDELVAEGNVYLAYGSMRLQADRVTFNRKTNVVGAEGNVVLFEGPQKIAGDFLEMNLKDGTGNVYGAVAFDEPTYLFVGDRVKMLSRERFILYKGFYTTCNQPTPYWGIRSSRAKVKLEGYARFRNLRLTARGAPVFYLPYWVWPIKRDRTSGFLIPEPNYSEVKGFSIRNQFYWVLGRSTDATITYDYFEHFGQGGGLELRFLTGPRSRGLFDGYIFEDADTGHHRHFARLEYNAQPWGGRFHVEGELASNLSYYRNFEYFLDTISTRRLTSRMFYSRTWKTYSLNALAEREANFLSDDDAMVLLRLPELSLRRRLTPLWKNSPLLLSFEAYGVSLDKTTPILNPPCEDCDDIDPGLDGILGTADDIGNCINGINDDGDGFTDETNCADGIDNDGDTSVDELDPVNEIVWDYERLVCRPVLSLPFQPGPWFSMNFRLRGFGTYYTHSVDPNDSQRLVEESLTHRYWQGETQILGPRFEKIFAERQKGYFSRFKHVIEPQVNYAYHARDEDIAGKNPTPIPRFDTYDSLSVFNHKLSYSLIQYFYGKPRGGSGSPAEIAKLSVRQEYSLNSKSYLSRRYENAMEIDKSYFSPVSIGFRFYPLSHVGLDASTVYDHMNQDFPSAQLTSRLDSPRGNHASLTWSMSRSVMTETTTSQQVRANAGMRFLDERLTLQSEMNYDIERKVLQHQRHSLRYKNQCSTFIFDVIQKRLGIFDDLEYRLIIELKDVGRILSI